MRIHYLYLLLLAAYATGCQKKLEAPVPDLTWDLFNNPSAVKLAGTARGFSEGVYRVGDATSVFGEQVALKWSYVADNTDTSYYCSIFCGKDVAYFILKGKRLGDSILLDGYWRKQINTETGVARLVIPFTKGARQLFAAVPVINRDSIVISGFFGDDKNAPTKAISFLYDRKLYNTTPFEVMAHRAGGRTSDLLPYAENSVGMVKFASRLGATGIEIDVRVTRDNVPIIYHDNTLNLRLIQKSGLTGPIENFSYQELYDYARLIDGQHLPTLREVLFSVVYDTNLRFVWMDIKYDGPLDAVRQLQQEFLQRAAAIGRPLQIVFGLPTKEALDRFKALPNYTGVPSLCELELQDVQDINARVWGPRWTQGLQNTEVATVKAAGRKAFVWTVDVPEYVDQFINKGAFDGLLSNYPSLVAYYYYVRQ